MKGIMGAILLIFAVVSSGCGRHVRLPHPGDEDIKAQKEESNKKEKYIKKIEDYDFKHKRLEDKAINKRSKGFNTKEAEEELKKMKALIKTAEIHILDDKFEELLEKDLEDLKFITSNINNHINHAPAGDESIKKEKIERKYMDERDEVAALFGEPKRTNKRIRGFTPIEFIIHDPTYTLIQELRFCKCLSDTGVGIKVRYGMLTDVEEWDYPEYGTNFIFMKLPASADLLMIRNDLDPETRDRAIVQICNEQLAGGYKLIYAGSREVNGEVIIDQLFTGRGRAAGTFGMEGLSRIAKATQVLKDLSIIAVLFNTKINDLNKTQSNLGNQFFELLKSVDASFDLAVQATSARRASEKAYEDFIKKQPKDIKEKISLVSKLLFEWQTSYSIKPDEIKKLSKIFPDKRDEIILKGMNFQSALEKLGKERENIDNQLFKASRDLSAKEFLFKQGKTITIFFLLAGVRYQFKGEERGEPIENPDIMLRLVFKRSSSKKEPPTLIQEKEIKIRNFSVRKTRDFERLTSFGVTFSIPKEIDTGTYEVYLEVKDNISAQTTNQTVRWMIVPEDSPDSPVVK